MLLLFAGLLEWAAVTRPAEQLMVIGGGRGGGKTQRARDQIFFFKSFEPTLNKSHDYVVDYFWHTILSLLSWLLLLPPTAQRPIPANRQTTTTITTNDSKPPLFFDCFFLVISFLLLLL